MTSTAGHRNCLATAALMSRHITGWMAFGTDLILHSVLNISGRWICLTPQLVPANPRFEFTPDPQLSWVI